MIVDQKEACRAIEKGEFIPYFQPLVNLRSGQLAGFEILARWNHPKRGLVLPGEFIHAAELDGWIDTLMQELLRQAIVVAHVLPAPLTLSVNVSPVQLRDITLARKIRSASKGKNFSLDRLIVEITESALTDNLDHALVVVNELKQLGCRIALDDFGTGYSSLLHLQSLPFDELKVDRSFVSAITGQRDSRKIVAAIVGLGQSLGLTTVGEGIETKEQAEVLLSMGCELGQGWLFGRPMPVADLPSAVAAHRQKLSTGHSNKLLNASAANIAMLGFERLAQLQAIYDNAPVGLAFLDRNMRHVNLNQRLADMNGLSVEEHIGKTPEQLIPDAFQIFEPYLLRALQGELITGLRVPIIGKNCEQTRLVSYQPVRDEAGEIIGVSVAIIDIDESKQAEEASRSDAPFA
jgi:PAS domain S-box-containing protein